MSLPLFPHELFGHATGLVLGVAIGFAFGFVMERAGFGRAPNLAAQFYFVDNRVFKVMFIAIATASLGLGVLSSLGLLDLSLVTVPATFLWPQLVGGLLLGAGFVVAGYCPGTGIAAAGSGNLDGLVTYAGVMAGSLVFGLAFPWLRGFYGAGDLGTLRIDQLLGVPFPVVALGVLAMAIGCFLAVERLEGFLARRSGKVAPDVAPRTRNRVFAGLATAGAAGIALLAIPSRAPVALPRAPGFIEPLELGAGLTAAPTDFYLVDARTPAACAAARLPGALCLAADDPAGSFLGRLPPTRTLVVYSQTGAGPVPAGALAFPGELRLLAGGFEAFQRTLLEPPAAPAEPTLGLLAAYRLQSALHGAFTGSATTGDPVRPAPVPVQRLASKKKGGGC